MINVDHNPVETEDGVWTSFQGTDLLIAHVSSMPFQRKLARLQAPYAKQIEQRRLPPDTQKEILCEAMSGTILKGWKKAVDKLGEPIEFTVPLGKQVLMQQVDVREFVTEFAALLENYRQEETKEVGKS